MLDLFSTRELAMGICLAALLVYSLCYTKTRKAWIPVIKTAVGLKLLIPAIALFAVGIAVAAYASKLSFWDNAYYKDAVMWVLFVGWPLCFGAISSKENSYFRNAVIDNVRITVVFECVFSTFTFSLLAEIVIILSTTFLVCLETVAKREEKSKGVAKLISWLLTVCGLIILILTVKAAISEFQMDMASSMLASLIIPLVLSILYVPFAYFLALYAAYELSFLRMRFCEPDKWTTRLWHRIKAVIICNFSLDKARTLQKSVRYMYKSMTEKEFNAYMKRIWVRRDREKL